MSDEKKMTRRQVIELLRKEAQELEDMPVNMSQYAANSRKAKMRRDLADKFERELDKTDD